MRVRIVGAGVMGLACALELAERGATVEVIERSARLGADACSWFAGGMLAPWCELEHANPLIAALGEEAIAWWLRRFTGTVQRGTLVVAHARDRHELTRFARGTRHFKQLGRQGIDELEPDLAGRFDAGLYFASEGHVDARLALTALAEQLEQLNVPIRFGIDVSAAAERVDCVVDCRGLAARDALADLRGVKGEMLLLRTREIALTRPIRLLHPRTPLYVIPRAAGLYMVGATSIEGSEPTSISARSVLELLSAAYALHPVFGAAHVVELGTGVRPAFPDNCPRLQWRDAVLHVNGLYRHGFLLAPALARMASEVVLHNRYFPEVMDDDHRQRRCS